MQNELFTQEDVYGLIIDRIKNPRHWTPDSVRTDEQKEIYEHILKWIIGDRKKKQTRQWGNIWTVHSPKPQ